jgi:folate-binding protein YgfZ
MSEVIQKATPQQSPLDDKHRALGATMIEHEGWSVPGSYGDESTEYATVREGGAGLIDLSSRGRFLVSGSEAVQFLNGLITNDMKTLEENRWMPAAFPNVQGRLIASVRVVRVVRAGEAETDENFSPTFLIDTEAVTHERVLKTIERFTLAGDFRVGDITNKTAQLTVQGSKAAELIRTVLGEEVSLLVPNGATRTSWQDAEIAVIRSTHTGENGFDVIVNAEHAESLWDSFLNAGARPVGYDALGILRIEAGIPRYGIDMDETNVVTEAALDEAVSYTKGCYVGQEIIARIKYRGHVAKKLSGVAFNQQVKVEAGANIKSIDDKDIGRVTSVTSSPRLNQTIALGYLKYDYLSPGTKVKIAAASGDVMATVAALPFVSHAR